MENSGIIRGHHIDYDLAYPLYAEIICTAPVPERDVLTNGTRDVRGVTAVREITTGERNVYVNAIGKDHDEALFS